MRLVVVIILAAVALLTSGARADALRGMSVSGDNPVEALADVAEGLRGVDPFANVVLFLDAWVEDVARVWTP